MAKLRLDWEKVDLARCGKVIARTPPHAAVHYFPLNVPSAACLALTARCNGCASHIVVGASCESQSFRTRREFFGQHQYLWEETQASQAIPKRT